MTDLDAILRAVVAEPADDTPRLVYAEMCDDLAGVVACPRCGGSGKHDLNPYDLAARYGTYRAGLMLDAARCAVCAGSGSVSNGLAERAEFVRVQVELARMPRLLPANVLCHQVEWEHFAGRLSGSVGKVRFEPPAPGASSGVGVLHYERRNPDREPLEKRERELFDRHKCEWFGDTALWLPTDEPQRASPHVPGFVVRRGFVDEWRGPLSAFAGRVGLDLAAVFAAHPIARVATDRGPTAASHPSGAWHWTWVENDTDSRVGLPRKLMAALSASGIARVFDSRDAAMDALSLACVNLGRAAAGLPPLA